MQATQKLEPDQQGARQRPELVLIDVRAEWRKTPLRTLIKIHKLIEENGHEMAEITISGYDQRVNRRLSIFPPRLHPVLPGEVYIAMVNVRAQWARDIEIEF